MLNGTNVYRTPKRRRKMDLETLGKVIAQMQGLIDSPVDETNSTEVSYHALTVSWHRMLQDVLIAEAKR